MYDSTPELGLILMRKRIHNIVAPYFLHVLIHKFLTVSYCSNYNKEKTLTINTFKNRHNEDALLLKNNKHDHNTKYCFI